MAVQALREERREQDGQGLGVAPPARQRNLPMVLVAVLVAAGSALAFALLWANAADRRPVLAVVDTVRAGQTIQASDLAVVRVSTDPRLDPVPASARARVLGQMAAVDLAPGSLLTRAQLGSQQLLGPGQALVGVALLGSQLPTPTLRAGDRVAVVQTMARAPGDATQAQLGRVLALGRVFAVRSQPDAAGAVLVSLAVDENAAPLVAGAAAADQVSLVLVPGR